MFQRYAVFFTPPTGALSDFGARWLGWDSAAGVTIDHPEFPTLNLEQLTKTPRPYGLHATIKAPFHLDGTSSADALKSELATLCAAHKPVTLDGLALGYQHGFVALRPTAESSDLTALETLVVQTLDHYRAPLAETALAKRRAARLSDRQDAQLVKWGYPYVMQDFQFHITLTGRVKPDLAASAQNALAQRLAQFLGQPYAIDALTLMGQDDTGRFHQIKRCKLGP